MHVDMGKNGHRHGAQKMDADMDMDMNTGTDSNAGRINKVGNYKQHTVTISLAEHFPFVHTHTYSSE